MSVFLINPGRVLLCVIQGDIYLICLKFEFAGRLKKKKKKAISNFLSGTFHSENCNVTNHVLYSGVVKAILGVLVERNEKLHDRRMQILNQGKLFGVHNCRIARIGVCSICVFGYLSHRP